MKPTNPDVNRYRIPISLWLVDMNQRVKKLRSSCPSCPCAVASAMKCLLDSHFWGDSSPHLDTFLKAGAVWGNDGSDAKSGIFCHGGRKEQAKGPVAGDLLRDVVRMHDTR